MNNNKKLHDKLKEQVYLLPDQRENYSVSQNAPVSSASKTDASLT